jgi:hypothetical protein
MSTNTMSPFTRQWLLRHIPAGRTGFAAAQRICPTCYHYYTPGLYRCHLRAAAHRAGRGWWR